MIYRQCDHSLFLIILAISIAGFCFLNGFGTGNSAPQVLPCLNAYQSIKLQRDLACDRDGIVVQRDNVVINLNGHTIKGPGAAISVVGIAVPNSDHVKVIGPGIIKNFQIGVLVTGSLDTNISMLKVEDNKVGIYVTGSVNQTIGENDIRFNDIGVDAHSSDYVNIATNDHRMFALRSENDVSQHR